MTEEKFKFGFTTRAGELEKAFTQIKKELEQKKVNWEKLQNEYDPFFQALSKAFSIGVDAKMEIPVEAFTFIEVSILIRLACTLGIELSETHERLAGCEKTIKELKLAIK